MRFFQRLKNLPALRQLVVFIGILGPGIITGSVDNDAGGITTYSVAGAMYGYRLLWTLVPAFIALLAVQEMNARMGIVTGKGLADLIRENFGVRVTFYIFVLLLIADIGNTATEFAGVAGSLMVLGVSKYISVPLAAVSVWILVVKGNYKISEKVFLLFSVFLLSYVVSAIMAKPHWGEIGSAIISPSIQFDNQYLMTVLGLVGTTVAPWMQFYMQSSVIEKGIKMAEYKYTVWDVLLGCIATIVVAFFIVISCAATLHENGIHIEEAKDAAMALKPLAGALAGEVFAFGLFVASVFSAAILPLATAFYVCEAFGFEAGIDKRFSQAPQFYLLFTSIIFIAVIIILIPGAPLITITIWTQVLNAILLPIVLICMMIIVNKVEIMENYTNNRLQNVVGWATSIILILLSAGLLISGTGIG
jgi:NRAMP (natural resistance-associated macrophage protein)-like metal ion transporter